MSVEGYSGRKLYINRNDSRLAAVRTKGVTHGKEPIDVTNDDHEGDRTLLSEPAQKQVDLSISGIVVDGNLANFLGDWDGESFLDVTVNYPDGEVLEHADGFVLTNFEITGEYNGAATFSAQLQSSGAATITPASS